MAVVLPGEQLRLEQAVYFDGYRLGTSSGTVTGEVKIRRGSDGFFWNGTTFVAGEAWLATSNGGNYHFYDFTVPSVVDEFYTAFLRPTGDDGALDEMLLVVRQFPTPVFDGVDFATGFPFK